MRSALVVAAVILLAAGCARGGAPSSADADAAFHTRAQELADAWHTALAGPAGQTWKTGLVSLQDLTVPPAAGLSDDTSVAFASGWYTLRAELSDNLPADTPVRFPDGSTLSVPLVSARAAYAELDRGDPPCQQNPGQPTATTPTIPNSPAPGGPVGAPAPHTCASLTVTGVTFGSTTLRTSRGRAVVPAWLFTVVELPEPVARAAVSPASVSPVATPSLPPMDPAHMSGLAAAQRLTAAGETRLSYTIGVGACDQNAKGVAYETDDAVVIGGTVTRPATGECASSLKLEPVSVTLSKPLGARVVLDAISGRPLVTTLRQA
jgi:hypothetical protein